MLCAGCSTKIPWRLSSQPTLYNMVSNGNLIFCLLVVDWETDHVPAKASNRMSGIWFPGGLVTSPHWKYTPDPSPYGPHLPETEYKFCPSNGGGRTDGILTDVY